MLRLLTIALLLADLGLFGWSHGWLRGAGLGPVDVAEPQRLALQVHPERLTVAGPGPVIAPASAPVQPRASQARASSTQ